MASDHHQAAATAGIDEVMITATEHALQGVTTVEGDHHHHHHHPHHHHDAGTGAVQEHGTTVTGAAPVEVRYDAVHAAIAPPTLPPHDHNHHQQHPPPQQQTTITATAAAAAPPASPRGLKRIAEQAIEASSPGHIAAQREQQQQGVHRNNRKRLCRYPGCTKVIKSQGHCQRHGARAKRCKVDGCDKQAQGTHDGMCKRHWKATNFPEEAVKKGSTPPEPEGESVYDSILPMSIAYRPVQQKPAGGDDHNTSNQPGKHDLLDPPAAPEGFQVMPLVAHLKEGTIAGKPAGWHRNAERRARGMFQVKGLSVQLEPWERQLALIEILLLSGGTPYANFKELAFAWGREKGFHHVLANSVCERRGEVERKKRSDAGKSMTEEEKQLFRSKLLKARDKNGTSKKSRKNGQGGAGGLEEANNNNNEGSAVVVVVGGGGGVEPSGTVDHPLEGHHPALQQQQQQPPQLPMATADDHAKVAAAIPPPPLVVTQEAAAAPAHQDAAPQLAQGQVQVQVAAEQVQVPMEAAEADMPQQVVGEMEVQVQDFLEV